MTNIIVRPATEADYEPFTKLDFTHTVGDRYLALERTGTEPEFTYSMRWRTGTPHDEVYSTYTVEDLHRLQKENDAFLVATLDGAVVGYQMLLLQPSHHGAAQMNDLAVHKPAQRQGVGRALCDAAAAWGRERGLRAIWASPNGKSKNTIDFYLSVGFRISGVNDRWNTNTADTEPGQHTIYMYLELD
jgi:ribosomal protein S18 acetylase RimI-like enzyme